MPKVQKDSWANYQTVTYCSSACNGAIKEYHPPGSEFGKQKGRYKKQNNVGLHYVHANCIDLFIVLYDKNSYTIKQRKVLKKAIKIAFYKHRSRPRENRFSPFLRSKSNRDTKRGVSFENRHIQPL